MGDPDDAPLFEELNRRKAVLFVHPSEIVGPPAPDVAAFAADFLLDTSRAAYRLVRNGFIRRYPDLKIILSHAGGFVPYASYRMAGAIALETSRPLEDVLDDFRSFYFDTAISSTPAALPSLMAFAKPGHVLFGSDWPFAPSAGVALFAGMLDAYAGLIVPPPGLPKPTPAKHRSVLENTEPNQTRPGVIRTHDQGIMSPLL